MAAEQMVIPGIVRQGLVVPQNDTPLPDGAHVGILLEPAELTPQLLAEFREWDAASNEAWGMINQWEQEQP